MISKTVGGFNDKLSLSNKSKEELFDETLMLQQVAQ